MRGGRATGVITRGGERIPADVVVLNPDLPAAYRDLLPAVPRRIERLRPSPSAVVLHVGSTQQYRRIATTTCTSDVQWRRTFDEIIHDGRLMSDPSLLVSNPTRADPALAPAGREVYYVLAPVPNLARQPLRLAGGPRRRYADELVATLERARLRRLRRRDRGAAHGHPGRLAGRRAGRTARRSPRRTRSGRPARSGRAPSTRPSTTWSSSAPGRSRASACRWCSSPASSPPSASPAASPCPHPDAIIVGAGLSGLSLAIHLAAGGWCRSPRARRRRPAPRRRGVGVLDGVARPAGRRGHASYRQVRVHAGGVSRRARPRPVPVPGGPPRRPAPAGGRAVRDRSRLRAGPRPGRGVRDERRRGRTVVLDGQAVPRPRGSSTADRRRWPNPTPAWRSPAGRSTVDSRPSIRRCRPFSTSGPAGRRRRPVRLRAAGGPSAGAGRADRVHSAPPRADAAGRAGGRARARTCATCWRSTSSRPSGPSRPSCRCAPMQVDRGGAACWPSAPAAAWSRPAPATRSSGSSATVRRSRRRSAGTATRSTGPEPHPRAPAGSTACCCACSTATRPRTRGRLRAAVPRTVGRAGAAVPRRGHRRARRAPPDPAAAARTVPAGDPALARRVLPTLPKVASGGHADGVVQQISVGLSATAVRT